MSICGCRKSVDYTDQITLFILVAGLNDLETQEDLLSLYDLTLDTSESKAIAKEAAKFSQSEMAGEKVNQMN